MNTVLTQEVKRFNVLILLIASSLKEMDKALKGLVMMSSQLETASLSLLDGKVPDMWRSKSYESSKPVGAFISDLKNRVIFFNKWIEEGHPDTYWISGFFFTHSFTTGIMQNVARKHGIPIDLLMFDFQVVTHEVTEKPEEGSYVYGMFLEAARWNSEESCMDESMPKTLYSSCPMMLLIPKL
jgi:dynein heavy chain